MNRHLSTALVALLLTSPILATEEPETIPSPEDVAEVPGDATETDSGLAFRVLEAGTGEEHPTNESWVRVHYTGWTTDGEMFDSSIQRDASLTLPISKVIDGWTEGIPLMVEGEKTRFWVPQELAYNGKAGLPEGMLVFDIELLEIFELPIPPEHLSAPAPDATEHKKGLFSKVLEAGDGKRKPKSTSQVRVHYTGWTTDGSMFDTTAYRGIPLNFPLTGVIKGWTSALRMMVEGEKRRVWVPAALAYEGVEDRPQGMLIFDIELVSITIY